jgi:peptidoglycan biosynthesis protein MviN/MurJ (putative lipid II flippase)
MKPVGFLAFPLSASLASIVNIAVLIHWLPRKTGAINLRLIYNYFLRLILVSGVAGVLGYAGFKISSSYFGSTFFPVLIATVIWGSLSLVVFYVGCRLIKIKEVDIFIRRFLKK